MVALNVFRPQEFPLCCFKVIMICASELMNSDEMALMLLYVLVGATASLLLLVIVDRPYRDTALTIRCPRKCRPYVSSDATRSPVCWSLEQ